MSQGCEETIATISCKSVSILGFRRAQYTAWIVTEPMYQKPRLWYISLHATLRIVK